MFNLILENIVKKSEIKRNRRIIYQTYQALAYLDHVAVIAYIKNNVKRQEGGRTRGLEINKQKRNIIIISERLRLQQSRPRKKRTLE